MKITTTAGTLKKGDKIGNRVVRWSEFRQFNLGYHVHFEDCEVPMPYGRNEPITVELANPGEWYLRNTQSKLFWHPIGSFWGDLRPKGFPDKETALQFGKLEEGRRPEISGSLEVVFLQ